MSPVTCLSCQYTTRLRVVLESCPNCGSPSGLTNSIRVAGLEIFPSVQFRIERPTYKRKHKYAREVKSSAEQSVNGQLVRVDQFVDRENDRYRKKVTVVDTGEVLRQVDYPLSEHRGHGSGKRRQN